MFEVCTLCFSCGTKGKTTIHWSNWLFGCWTLQLRVGMGARNGKNWQRLVLNKQKSYKSFGIEKGNFRIEKNRGLMLKGEECLGLLEVRGRRVSCRCSLSFECKKSKSKIVGRSFLGPNRTHAFCHSLQPWARRQPAARPICAASCSF